MNAYRFFLSKAGYSYNPSTETKAQGRIRTARSLAAAEQMALNENCSFEWQQDDCTSQEFSNVKPYYYLWACVMHNANGEIVQSIGGCDFGRNRDPWMDDYRRVVEAELACDYFA